MMVYMFTDTKLNKHFNSNNEDMFTQRLLYLAKKGDYRSISISQSPVMDDCREYALNSVQTVINKRSGKVYIANNLLHLDQLKIGRTAKSIEERERSLNSAGVIGTVKILYWVNTLDAVMTELLAHKAIYDSHTEKEFFSVDYDRAVKTIVECAVNTNTFYISLQEHITSC